MPDELFDPWSHRPAAPERETLTLTHEDGVGLLPGEVIRMALEPLDTPRGSAANDAAQRLIREHLGDPEDEDAQPEPYLAPDGSVVELSESLIQNVCQVEAMQAGDHRWDFDRLLGLSIRLPGAWAEVSRRASKANRKYAKSVGLDRGNGHGPLTKPSSKAASKKASPTPRSSLTSSPASTA